jgi:hypothetical protein
MMARWNTVHWNTIKDVRTRRSSLSIAILMAPAMTAFAAPSQSGDFELDGLVKPERPMTVFLQGAITPFRREKSRENHHRSARGGAARSQARRARFGA